ncbi:hypothetical protein BTO03_07910 [Vibrio parahaemolyticus]|nr:hypothetical protein BTO03_07910 [Vibrio parahaemolyticus]
MPSTISTLPCASGTDADWIDNLSPSTSVSLVSTSMVTAVSSCIDVVSSTATGLSFTGVTVTVTFASSVKSPSVTI